MTITLWLATLPLWLLAIIIVVIPTCLSMLGPILVRRWFTLERLTANNEVAGFKFAVLGVIYAVLLGFAVIVVWQKFRDAEDAVAKEAATAVTLVRLSAGLDEANGIALRDRLATYLRAAIADDWPAIYHSTPSQSAVRAVNEIYSVVLGLRPTDGRGVALQSEMLRQLDSLHEIRRMRSVLAEGVVPGVIWAVLSLGAATTIGFTFFFGTQNLRAQALMAGLLSVLIFMALMVLLAINRPFTGDVSVGADPLLEVLREDPR